MDTTLTQPIPEQETRLSDVASTALLTLYCRALESQAENPILSDPKAVEITQQLTPLLAEQDNPLAKSLASGRVNQNLQVHIALRARYYDHKAQEFIQQHPEAVIVNLGAGMDTRYHRLGHAEISFYDLDLPELIALKRRFVAEQANYHLLPYSVFDYGWMEVVRKAEPRPTLFLAEGLLMYLEPERVRELVLKLRETFPGAELVCEVVNQRWLSASFKPLISQKMQGSAKVGKQAEFKFGVSRGDEFESWAPGIQLLEEWSYFESDHPKLGWIGWLKNIKLFTRTQWTVHYRLGEGIAG